MRQSVRLARVVLFLCVLASCAADANDASGDIATEGSNEITGSVEEWKITVTPKSANAGEVKFTIENKGTIGHEFLVVRTDILDGQIPLDGDHFAEPSEGLEVIDEIGEYPAGTTELLVLSLEAGNYQLVCNLPGHYAAGMHASFVVS